MPELPEVQVLSEQLHHHLSGKTISSAHIETKQIVKVSPIIFQKALVGREIQKVFRYGKYLCFRLDSAVCLWVHLGMTGQLLLEQKARSLKTHEHMMLSFKSTRMCLFFHDVRKFGKIFLSGHEVLGGERAAPGIGPDPFEIKAQDFVHVFKSRTGRIKSLLLNQKLVSGIGNIYADESLYRAGIDPRRRPYRVKIENLSRLHQAICETLTEAIQSGGSTIDDYRHTNGDQGSFQKFHRVYGKEGKTCFRCHALIRRVVLAGRSSYFCQVCQK